MRIPRIALTILSLTQEVLELRASVAAERNRRLEAESARDQENCRRLKADANAVAATSAAAAARDSVLAAERRLRSGGHQVQQHPLFIRSSYILLISVVLQSPTSQSIY
jgi:hypothetical protein